MNIHMVMFCDTSHSYAVHLVYLVRATTCFTHPERGVHVLDWGFQTPFRISYCTKETEIIGAYITVASLRRHCVAVQQPAKLVC